MSKPARINLAAIAAFLFFIFCAPVSLAQCPFTTVTGTVTDPNGLPYSNGTITATLSGSAVQPLCGGVAFSGFSQANLDITGSFSMNLAANTSIVPSGTHWVFSVNGNSGLPPPVGQGPQQFTTGNITITGSTQSITSALSALATALTVPLNGGGSAPGSPNFSLQFNSTGALGGVVNSSYNSGTGALTLPLIGNAAIKAAAGDAVQWVSTTGNDSNDGLSFGTAKLTAYTAACSLPGGNCSTLTAGIGTIYAGPLSTWGGPGGSHAGMWLAGAGDPNNLSLPTGWLHSAGGITVIGYGGQGASAANGHGPKTELAWGGGTNTLPAYWLSGLSLGIHFQNIFWPNVVSKIGIDSNNSRNGTGGTSGVWLDNTGFNLGNGSLGLGPSVDIGSNTFWVWIADSVVSGDIAEDYNFAASPTGLVRSGGVVTGITTVTNDIAVGDIITVSNPNDTSFNGSFPVTAVSGSPQTTVTWSQAVADATSGGGALFTASSFGISINPGTGSGSGLIFIHDSNFNNGGVRVSPGTNGSGAYVNHVSLEGNPTGPTPPVILITSPSQANNVQITGVETSDVMNSVTTPAVRQDIPVGAIGPFTDGVIVNRVQGQNVNVQGPMHVDGQYANNLQSENVGLLQQGETGTARNRVYGQTDAARRGFAPVAARFANIALPSASWILLHPGNAGAALTTGVAAPDGTTGAVTGSQTGGTQNAVEYFAASHAVNLGDYFITGAWSQSNSSQGAGGGAVLSLTTGSGNTLSQYQQGVPYIGDGEWEWTFSIGKIVATGTANPNLTASVQFTTAAPQTVYAPVLMYIPAGSVSDNEAYEIAYNLQSYAPGCPVGSVCNVQGVTFGCSGVSGAMTAGAITISNSCIIGTRPIQLTAAAKAGTQGFLSYTQSAGSLVISSSSGTDTSTVSWAQE